MDGCPEPPHKFSDEKTAISRTYITKQWKVDNLTPEPMLS